MEKSFEENNEENIERSEPVKTPEQELDEWLKGEEISWKKEKREKRQSDLSQYKNPLEFYGKEQYLDYFGNIGNPGAALFYVSLLFKNEGGGLLYEDMFDLNQIRNLEAPDEYYRRVKSITFFVYLLGTKGLHGDTSQEAIENFRKTDFNYGMYEKLKEHFKDSIECFSIDNLI